MAYRYHHLHRSFFIPDIHIGVSPNGFHYIVYPIPLHYHRHISTTRYNNFFTHQVWDDETLIIDAAATTRPQMDADDETLILGEAVVTSGPRRPHADDPGRLSQHEVLKYIKVGGRRRNIQDSDICVICQDALCQENEMIGSLCCGHEYHVACISQWLQQKTTCPLCKSAALPVIGQ